MAQSLVRGQCDPLAVYPRGQYWGPVLFNFFINDLNDEAEYTLTKLVYDKKLGGVGDMPEGRAAIQGDHDRLEKWAHRNFMKFNKKSEILHPGEKQPHARIYAGAHLVGKHLAETDLRVLSGTKWNMS